MEFDGDEESALAAAGGQRSKRTRTTTTGGNQAAPARKKRKGRNGRTETKASRERRENSQKQGAAVRLKREERRKKRNQKPAATNQKSITNAGPRVVCNDDEGEYYEVEKVVGKRIENDGVKWKIRWKGCREDEDTWEPDEMLSDSALEEAKLYEKKLKEEKSRLTGIENRNADPEVSVCAEDRKLPPPPKPESIVHSSSRDPHAGALVQPSEPDVHVSNKQEHIHTKPPSETKPDPQFDIRVPLPQPLPSEPDAVFSKQELENASSKPRASSGRKRVTAAEAAAYVDKELPWAWNDDEQVVFRSVDRINVNDNDAGERVTEARMNGTPVVLVGHKGWANFAKPWLLPSAGDAEDMTNDQGSKEPSLLDLSLPHQLNLPNMIHDIGQEDVPIVVRDYDEQNPIKRRTQARDFMVNSASDFSPTAAATEENSKDPKLYLHQWQFPLSETAGRKLCHENNPLPSEIFGEDLLKYLLGDELPQCKLDSPYQYLFMGAQGTMSKLHRDNGGLAITIAPIVGEKECVLVHRSDGTDCLYNLDADLEKIDLQVYPLMSQARIWKTVVCPGEILLMPQGTYHQCRNLTACLSYSRFHLDTVNIRSFFQSMIDGDAPEIDHEMILYNAADALVEIVDQYVDKIRKHVQNPKKYEDVPLSNDMIRKVKTLRCLRNFCREIDRRKAVQTKVKGRPISAGTVPAEVVDDEGRSRKEREWDIMTGEIDSCLHDFHFRRMKRKPRFRPTIWDDTLNRLSTGRVEGTPIIADTCGSSLERAFLRLPDISAEAPPSESTLVEPSVSDLVTVHMMGKSVKGEILEIREELSAALLKYEEFPDVFDEYQPYESLRIPRSGESAAEVKYDDVKPGLAVVTKAGSEREVSWFML